MPDQASRDVLAGLRGFERQALHAAHLGFVHPITKEELGFDSPLPADMQGLIEQIETGIAKRAAGIK
jgi:23S rRNA pseudouridine1911/1915/1917 synthase